MFSLLCVVANPQSLCSSSHCGRLLVRKLLKLSVLDKNSVDPLWVMKGIKQFKKKKKKSNNKTNKKLQKEKIPYPFGKRKNK